MMDSCILRCMFQFYSIIDTALDSVIFVFRLLALLFAGKVAAIFIGVEPCSTYPIAIHDIDLIFILHIELNDGCSMRFMYLLLKSFTILCCYSFVRQFYLQWRCAGFCLVLLAYSNWNILAPISNISGMNVSFFLSLFLSQQIAESNAFLFMKWSLVKSAVTKTNNYHLHYCEPHNRS